MTQRRLSGQGVATDDTASSAGLPKINLIDSVSMAANLSSPYTEVLQELLPASKGQLKAENAALAARINQQDTRIDKQDTTIDLLLAEVKSLIPVSHH